MLLPRNKHFPNKKIAKKLRASSYMYICIPFTVIDNIPEQSTVQDCKVRKFLEKLLL